MSRTITGTLYYPDGNTLGEGTLKFIASETSTNVLEASIATAAVSAIGAYNITLLNGYFLVYLNDSSINHEVYLGKVAITTGSNITLETLLTNYSVSVPGSVQDYVDGAITTAGEGYQDIGDYVITGYDTTDIPTNPINLALTQLSNIVESKYRYDIEVTWDASSNESGNSIRYDVVWTGESEGEEGAATGLSTTSYVIHNVNPGETYTIEVFAYSANTERPAASTAIGAISIISMVVTPLDVDDISVTAGLKYIVLHWDLPEPLLTQRVQIYTSTSFDFTPNETNMIYWGEAPTFIYNVDDTTPRWFKFVVIDYRGYSSSITTYESAVAAIKISETTIGQLVEAGAIQAQQMADGAIVQDKIAANAVIAGKLAVLNLDNLVENHDFTLYTNNKHNSWDYGETTPVDPGPDGYIVLPQNSSIDNEYQFACAEGDKFYLAVSLTWTATAQAVDKGALLVFLDSEDNELSSGYTITDATTAPTTDLLVYGFVVAPADTVKAFVRLKTSGTQTNITFKNIYCRHGAAVLIDDGEITADKINVIDLFAAEITINNGGSIQVGENPSVSGGIILGDAIGLIAYDNFGNEVITLSPQNGDNNGAGYFKGTLYGGKIQSNNTLTGAIELESNLGFIRTKNKDHETASTPGFFIGYDTYDPGGGARNRQAFSIGSSASYLRWNSSAEGLRISGKLEAATGSIGNLTARAKLTVGDSSNAGEIEVGQYGEIHSAGKDSYTDDTAGYWFGYSSGYKMYIGNATNHIKWDGSGVDIAGSIHSNGKDNYTDDTAGFWLGNDSGTYKLYIGDSNEHLKWNGSNLIIKSENKTTGPTAVSCSLTLCYRSASDFTYYSPSYVIDTGVDLNSSTLYAGTTLGLEPRVIITSAIEETHNANINFKMAASPKLITIVSGTATGNHSPIVTIGTNHHVYLRVTFNISDKGTIESYLNTYHRIILTGFKWALFRAV